MLKGMAHGNGSSWKACLNLPLISLEEEVTHIKREHFKKEFKQDKDVRSNLIIIICIC